MYHMTCTQSELAYRQRSIRALKARASQNETLIFTGTCTNPSLNLVGLDQESIYFSRLSIYT